VRGKVRRLYMSINHAKECDSALSLEGFADGFARQTYTERKTAFSLA
jgi:hypothetical protein